MILQDFKIQSNSPNASRQAFFGSVDNLEEQLNIFLAGLPVSQFRSIDMQCTESISGYEGNISYTLDTNFPLPITAGTGGDWVRKQVFILDDDSPDTSINQSAVNSQLASLDPATTFTFHCEEEATTRYCTMIVYEKTFS